RHFHWCCCDSCRCHKSSFKFPNIVEKHFLLPARRPIEDARGQPLSLTPVIFSLRCHSRTARSGSIVQGSTPVGCWPSRSGVTSEMTSAMSTSMQYPPFPRHCRHASTSSLSTRRPLPEPRGQET